MLLAARAGWRGMGRVEPNPMVGCVIGLENGTVLGIGHHGRFGGPHAEVEAIADCRSRGCSPTGATAWVTLEPCSHDGKTPPCADALIRAGVARVVIARRDPNPVSTGGVQKLRAAGIVVDEAPGLFAPERLSAPFVKRITRGMPWVIAKWAQTIDGKVATRTGDSRWISGESSRRWVHRLRARVDAVLTGIGTVRRDDPMLTARGVVVRRVARRCVIDPALDISPGSALVRTAREAPVTLYCSLEAERGARSAALRAAGVEVVAVGESEAAGTGLDTRWVLRHLGEMYGATTVLAECGPGLMGRLIAGEHVDECVVFIGSILLGDPSGLSAACAGQVDHIAGAKPMRLLRVKRLGEDVMLGYARGGD